MQPSRVRVGEPRVAGPFHVRGVVYPAGLRQSRHSHEKSSVTILLGGEIRERTRTGEETGSALSVVTKPAGVRHADEVGPGGARTVQIAFDRGRVAGVEEGGAKLDRWSWRHGSPAVGPLLSLARSVLWGSPTRPALEDLVLEGLAALDSRPAGRSSAPGWLARVKEALDDDPFSERTVAELARLVGAHPVSVSRGFRRQYGLTITEYRRRRRLHRAATLASDTSTSLSRVAHAAGYADHPHMCREFRRFARLTPSAFRRLARSG